MESYTEDFQCLEIELEEIKSATDTFNDNKVIGVGGFGKVYKGEVSHSKGRSMVAIKRLDARFGQGEPEFWKEVTMLSRYTHENLISLLGYCNKGGEKILVYEHASLGSLDRHLGSTNLDWTQRIKICIDVARGLSYLHNDRGTLQRILHRDIKSSNILLGDNWNAKVSDFGLSKLGPANQQYTMLFTNVVGTPGYCDPLYMETYSLTQESDVYSFGVVLLEVLCGRLCYENSNGHFEILVPMWKDSYKHKKLDELIFQDLKQQMAPSSLETFSNIAFQCLQRTREERPRMYVVVEELEIALEFQRRHDLKLPEMSHEEIRNAVVTPLNNTSAEEQNVLPKRATFLNAFKSGLKIFMPIALMGTLPVSLPLVPGLAALEVITTPTKKHLSFVADSRKYVREMVEKMEKLNTTAQDMQNRKDAADANNRVVSEHLSPWLEAVNKINDKAQRIPTAGTGCCNNIAKRYKAGKQSNDIIQMIKDIEKGKSEIEWTNQLIPLAMVTSTSARVHHHDSSHIMFNSRELIFKDALEFLQSNNEAQKMIALCGEGGVGKTTMMEEVKKAVIDSKMFDWVVKVVIGKYTDLNALQQAIAEYTGEPLTERNKYVRADRLRNRFEWMSQDGKKKILVIMDDLWKVVNLRDIGLVSPLPNGFKLLLTSRFESVCTQMGVKTDSIFNFGGLHDAEAKTLFFEIVKQYILNSDPDDFDQFQKIGEDIVNKCGGLPFVIKVMANNLIGKTKEEWKDALSRLQDHDLNDLDNILEKVFL